ncbi:MAG: endopeptidase La [Clostridiales bacterium]|jgi:ATP-dependent Lon protease|nr:endopeptidase La [Clostridiales bacterium]
MDNYSQSIEDLILGNEPIKNTIRAYKLVALRGVVVLPYVNTSFDIGRDRSILAVNKTLECGEHILLVTQKNATVTDPAPADLYRVGTVAMIKQVLKLPGENVRVVVQGLERAEITGFITSEPYFEVSVRPLGPEYSPGVKLEVLKRKVKEAVVEYNKIDNKAGELVNAIVAEEDPYRLGFYAAHLAFRKEHERQRFLETVNVEKAFEMLLFTLLREIEILRTDRQISAKVRRQMDKNQKEYYLREQLKAIHDELGDSKEEIEEFKKRAAESGMSAEVLEKVNKEIVRMSKMSATSPETAVSRTYIETLSELPWTAETADSKDLKRAAEILNREHYGLEEVKERILEYLAVTQLTKSLKGPILCFVGPPGVGKTSIARSVAHCLDRKFVSASLGGIRDEAEIRGHRRTYIGAIPGIVINNIKTAGTRNPVFLLDEIDKMTADFRGDPAGAMLEVLDPEQNFHFRDHYLDVPFDLSKTLFIATANTADTIPAPLLDRMEIIELPGYTMTEKKRIALDYLVKKQEDAHGLAGRLAVEDAAVEQIVMKYTREAGVRSLERQIAKICRKAARKVVEASGETGQTNGENFGTFAVTADTVPDYLGAPKYSDLSMNETDEVGAATGLAWTSAGGVTMTIEVALIPGGKGEIQLTGKLGDVMKESAYTALTVVKKFAPQFGIDSAAFAENNIHLHVPEGATPKDGPSAGITLAVALLSAFAGRPVRRDIAMTGEVTLRGKVLAIGGLKDKAFACHRAGIRTLVIPKENHKDLSEIHESIRSDLTIAEVSNIGEVFGLALLSDPDTGH